MSGDVEDTGPNITTGQKMISAMSGSFLSSLLVTPFDVVRVRLQSQPQPHSTSVYDHASAQVLSSSSKTSISGLRSCCREVFFANNNLEYCLTASRGGDLSQSMQQANCVLKELQNKSFTSTFDGLQKIARQEGFTTLWRGLSPTLIMGIPANIIYFTGYDWLRFDKNSFVNKLFSDNYAPLLAGSIARIVAGTVVSPIEMIRTRMQARTSTGGNHFAKTVKGINKTIATHGYSSLWRGLTLTLWRDVPFSGIYWWGYETIRENLTAFRNKEREKIQRSESSNKQFIQNHTRESHSETFSDSFIAGSISGAVASILTMPFDVGKTRRQVFVGSSSVIIGDAKTLAPEERSMLRFLWHILQEEGISGLWRGCIPRTLKVAPACAIMISCYEVGKRSFRSLNEERSGRQ
ncbi:Solute carrier family 25 member 39 [Golovinomyces cichoracearum]|uniref:Solute carrier family 25 member 39 n=1 Tax=Golovinomyces cichoracearum TaxID=62708 RepID=A0A420H6Z6_9PEZI|nr:Solute carrier family 25 member 39 [Golovinomyces cichoracearum]